MLLKSFPRVPLAHLPTPLEFLPNLTKHLGGPEIWVKRDDCTGLATGGNKTRKLEFSMGAALEKGADTIITVGAVQSNHVRQTAAAACKLGMKCEVLLEHRVADPSELYRTSGNVLREYAKGTDFDAAMEEVADEVRARGGLPYIVPGGASNPVGALGYVGCGEELLRQFSEQDLKVDHIVTATGSAGTHGGLAVGLRASGSDLPILGIGVNAPQDVQEERVYDLACETAELIGKPGCVSREDIIADCDYIGPGYGEPTGLLFDPVYSGKALAGMIDYVRQGRFGSGERIVFLHTGGAAGLFAYADTLDLEDVVGD